MKNLSEEVRRRIEENRAKAAAAQETNRKELKGSEMTAPANANQKGVSMQSSVVSFPGQNMPSASSSKAVNGLHGAQNSNQAGGRFKYSYNGPHIRGGQNNSDAYYNNNVYNKNSSKPKQSTTTSGIKAQPIIPRVTGLCILISGAEFRLQCGYNAKLTELLRTFPGSRYDASTRHYCFRLEHMETLLKKAREEVPEVSITGLPTFIPKVLRSNVQIHTEDVEMSSIDPKLRKALRPFQREGVLRGIAQRGRILIADDMGLGKTVQALAIATYYREEWPLLVVCPSSMRFAWRDAFLQWLPSITEHDIQVVVKAAEPLGANQVIISSYDIVSRRSEDLMRAKFKVLIFDESHFLKGYKSQRTKVALELSGNARRIILLSGTPALSRPIELYPQIQCLAVRNWPVVHDFALRYCNARETRFGWDFSGSSYLDELHILLREVIMVRRLKSEVLEQLPDKQRIVVLLDPTLVRKQDRQAAYLSQMVNNIGLSTAERRGVLIQYFAKSAELKMSAVCKYVEEMLEGDCKFLVFAHHSVMLNAVSELLEKKRIDFIRIDGKVSSDVRQQLVEQFQSKTSCRVAVLSITAANAGITLHSANLVIFAELFWNPGILTQAEDRVHRIGQKQNCVVQYLIARETSDDYIWPLIEQKLVVLNKVGLSKDTFSDAMNRVSEQVVDNDLEENGAAEGDSADNSRPPSKRQRSIKDFMNTTEDSFWIELSQDTSTLLPEDL
ncbi:SWI/SNF-related matrix-associated actin-dependent regulator of chromatin subfamily A-like protein 1 isoform X2 [Varroa jacobsoni]|uniref:SWI/SNF-related matrix-associated actin-dependent regulator of chromatin subfamily A-like protein 1 n=1 Tax=Varroa destructor TaxID=109461 RepID=A0A7M7L6L0_VARDE|nr:SWI/SNF-related matrix-associated actin-dependent regulator of chromatin subfamily A-like protein 1 isoform X2 [Varroa destructor]XP_022701784.1 SWI/SNF-related matrix-associated actin-dependent regulator of chromatin subfamily A-like protein 1 isoform X2 [Varroa jacobsoni]